MALLGQQQSLPSIFSFISLLTETVGVQQKSPPSHRVARVRRLKEELRPSKTGMRWDPKAYTRANIPCHRVPVHGALLRPHLATTAQRLAVYGLGRLPLGADGRSEVVKVLGRAKLHFISKQFKGLQLRSLSKHISTRLPTRQAAEAERQPVDRCNTCALAA